MRGRAECPAVSEAFDSAAGVTGASARGKAGLRDRLESNPVFLDILIPGPVHKVRAETRAFQMLDPVLEDFPADGQLYEDPGSGATPLFV